MADIKFVAPCLLGLEGLVADNLKGMEALNVQAQNGRVFFEGDEAILARANLHSRYCERIQVVIGTFKATTFDELFEGTKALDWERWISANDAFPVKGYSINSKLFSVSDCQSIVKKAVVERLKSVYNISWFEETGSTYQIAFSIMKDEVTLTLDTSGVGLHKRGYRPSSNDAPIKETLAAAMANISQLRHYHTLYDPFCGSGTILIEGAMLAHNIAPGIRRSFASEKWDKINPEIWRAERARALDMIVRDTDFIAYGSDVDPHAIALTELNARRAGVLSKMKLRVRDVKDFERLSEKGTVICNPPYGERMLDRRMSEEIYRDMGRVFERMDGWSYSIITANEQFESFFGRPADKRRKLYNGMIKCQVYMYFKKGITK